MRCDFMIEFFMPLRNPHFDPKSPFINPIYDYDLIIETLQDQNQSQSSEKSSKVNESVVQYHGIKRRTTRLIPCLNSYRFVEPKFDDQEFTGPYYILRVVSIRSKSNMEHPIYQQDLEAFNTVLEAYINKWDPR